MAQTSFTVVLSPLMKSVSVARILEAARLSTFLQVRCASLVIGLVVGCQLLGCQSPTSQTQQPLKDSKVVVLVPSETKEALEGAVGTASITTSPGSSISFSYSAVNGQSGLRDGLISRDLRPALVLLQSDTELDSVFSDLAASSGSLAECHSLFFSPLVVTYRASDLFEFAQVDEPVSPSSLLFNKPAEGGKPLPWLLIPHPHSSASGLAAMISVAAGVTNREPNLLTADALRLNTQELRDAQSRVIQYPFSDKRTLDWLHRQEGGLPLLALTTQQQFHSFMTSKPDAGLQVHPVKAPGVGNNYPLCVVTAPWISQEMRTAAIAAQRHLLGVSSQGGFSKFGFAATPGHEAVAAPERVPPTIASPLLSHWQDFSKGSAPTIVIDTSVSMDGSRMQMIKDLLAPFLSSLGGGRVRTPVSLVQFQSIASVVVKFSTDPIVIQTSLNQLKPIGASAFRDGVMRAVELYDDASAPGLRHPILVFVDGKDTSSTTTVEQFQLALPSLLSRKGIMLYVIGIGPDTEDYENIPALVTSVGGFFKSVKNGEVAEEMASIWQDLR